MIYRENQYVKPPAKNKYKQMIDAICSFFYKKLDTLITVTIISIVSAIITLPIYYIVVSIYQSNHEKQDAAGLLLPVDERKELYKKNASEYFGSILNSTAKIGCTHTGSCVVMQDDWTNPQHLICNKANCIVK